MYSRAYQVLLLAVLAWAVGLVQLGVSPALGQAPTASASAGGEAGDSLRSANYQLRAGDTITVKVFREPDLDSQQRLSKDGTINLPLLGVIKVAGRTTNEASSMIRSLLDRDYVVNPQVSVSVTNYNKQKYTVLGSVGSPGSYEIPEEQSMDLLTAIARAGGFTRLAEPSKVTIRRSNNGQEGSFTVNAKKMMNDPSAERVLIQPNDVINVRERIF